MYFFLFNESIEIRIHFSLVIRACFRIEGNHIAISTNFSVGLRSFILILDKCLKTQSVACVFIHLLYKIINSVNSRDR